MNGNCEREMTLDEWVERLPEIHRARKEYAALKDKVEKFTSTNSAMDAIAELRNRYRSTGPYFTYSQEFAIDEFVAWVQQQHQ